MCKVLNTGSSLTKFNIISGMMSERSPLNPSFNFRLFIFFVFLPIFLFDFLANHHIRAFVNHNYLMQLCGLNGRCHNLALGIAVYLCDGILT